MTAEATILVVDDQAANLGVLFHALEQAAYSVRVVNSGEAALASVQRAAPDLILLDVMMPELDGFETCRRLKAAPASRDIPVIFLTALADPINEVAGLQLGAVDYITKPIQIEIALARIRTHLALRRLQQALQQRNAELDAYARTVAHDLKNPLTSILAAAHMLIVQRGAASDAELNGYANLILRAGQRANTTINELLALAGVSRATVTLQPLDMGAIIEQVRDRLSVMLAESGATLELPERWPSALGHGPWVELVWSNYLSNGLKYGGKPPRLTLGGAVRPDGMVEFWVSDNGPGLAEEARAQLFTEWTRLGSGPEQGHGLGLAIVRRIVERLGGSVDAGSEPGQGSIFSFTLPATPQR